MLYNNYSKITLTGICTAKTNVPQKVGLGGLASVKSF